MSRGILTAPALANALRMQAGQSTRLGHLLITSGLVDREDINDALAQQYRTGRIDLHRDAPDPDLIDSLGIGFCLAQRLLPWRRVGATTIIAAVYPETFLDHRDLLEDIFGPVRLCLADEDDLNACLTRIGAAQLVQQAETRTEEALSCRNWTGRPMRLLVLGLAMTGLTGAIAFPATLLLVLTAIALGLLLLSSALKICAWRSSAHTDPTPVAEVGGPNVVPFQAPQTARLPTVSLLVPLYREDAVALRLVDRLARLDYPTALLDICLVMEADDATTLATLRRTKLPRHMRVLSVPPSTLRTKPRAMNFALDFCRGDIIGVYDAEDAPEPDQIAKVVARFAAAPPDVACIQGRLGYYNATQNVMSRCFAIEYANWFSVILPGIARLGLLVPLGGTTLFFRRRLLEDLGGWDAHNVTEDADLGIRLGRAGYRTELLETTTWEEANYRPLAWVRQRSRWIKGYAMTYATHMSQPGQMLSQVGPRAFAGFQVMFLGTFLQTLIAPVLWIWWAIPLGVPAPVPAAAVPFVWVMLCLSEILNLSLCIAALRRTRQLRLIWCVPLINFYNVLASFAAYKALAELMTRPFYWDKTSHGITSEHPAPRQAAYSVL
ncbi:MAG: glycosyltransferase [Qingshengfaniella sp.]